MIPYLLNLTLCLHHHQPGHMTRAPLPRDTLMTRGDVSVNNNSSSDGMMAINVNNSNTEKNNAKNNVLLSEHGRGGEEGGDLERRDGAGEGVGDGGRGGACERLACLVLKMEQRCEIPCCVKYCCQQVSIIIIHYTKNK